MDNGAGSTDACWGILVRVSSHRSHSLWRMRRMRLHLGDSHGMLPYSSTQIALSNNF